MKPKLSKKHRNNLERLAGYLLNLPKNYQHFRMSTYLNQLPQGNVAKIKIVSEGIQLSECGAVGCALGHGPAAGVLMPQGCVRVDDNFKTIRWDSYSAECFGSTRFGNMSNFWEWCFSAEWSSIDNTPYGAGMRIIWMLTNGLPEDWYDQMAGHAKLCYK